MFNEKFYLGPDCPFGPKIPSVKGTFCKSPLSSQEEILLSVRFRHHGPYYQNTFLCWKLLLVWYLEPFLKGQGGAETSIWWYFFPFLETPNIRTQPKKSENKTGPCANRKRPSTRPNSLRELVANFCLKSVHKALLWALIWCRHHSSFHGIDYHYILSYYMTSIVQTRHRAQRCCEMCSQPQIKSGSLPLAIYPEIKQISIFTTAFKPAPGEMCKI